MANNYENVVNKFKVVLYIINLPKSVIGKNLAENIVIINQDRIITIFIVKLANVFFIKLIPLITQLYFLS